MSAKATNIDMTEESEELRDRRQGTDMYRHDRERDPKVATRIGPTDLERHKRMLEHVAAAQALREQIDALVGRQQQLMGAYQVWCEELHERYGLSLDGSEGVQPDGTISRASGTEKP